MYKLPYFTETDHRKVIQLMRDYPFALVSCNGADGFPAASQLPLETVERDGEIILLGHMMKATDHYRAMQTQPNVLVVFTGPDCYVSASWYTKPAQAGTWNYMSVYAKGIIRFTSEAETREALKRITNLYESPGSPARFECLSKEYVDALSPHVAGFEIKVSALENVFKLSQNHSTENRNRIIEQLKKGNEKSRTIAAGMEKIKHDT